MLQGSARPGSAASPAPRPVRSAHCLLRGREKEQVGLEARKAVPGAEGARSV